ncbi:MAG: filamentous hemagglutinin N-terminal domain-containing protein [Candidatus Omnitrophica bacterium]|nr:filamentous hemagglutinin N-terminal domain-containing protein [Candidatus Omnitrophota bacterium]
MMKKLMKVIDLLLVILLLCPPHYVRALPEGEAVVSGSADFSYPDANTMNITTSDRVIIDYQSFSIAQPETVRFIQPSGSSVALNRVRGGDPSTILGSLLANGKIFLINPNGILFGANARVDAAGLVASTLDISNEDFLEGRLNFQGVGGYIINQGILTAKPGGYICLLSGAVDNQGAIQTVLGTVVLASGEKATLNLDDLGQISVVIDESVKQEVFGPDGEKQNDAVKNSGTISAAGGIVTLTAKALNDVFDHAINNSGRIEAKSLVERNGEVELVSEGSGIVQNTGDIEVSGVDEAVNGGSVLMQGERVGQFGKIEAGAVSGDGGNIELLGNDVVALGSNSVTSANTQISGNGGNIIILGKQHALVWLDAVIVALGGAIWGDGGFIETSGNRLEIYSVPDVSAPNGSGGTWLLDPEDINITNVQANITQAGAGDPGPISFTPTSADTATTLDVNNIITALNNGSNVTVNTASGGTATTGIITVSSAIAKTADGGSGDGSTLTLTANDDIVVNDTISSSSGKLNLVFSAADLIDINSAITTNGGSFSSTSKDFSLDVSIDTGIGDIEFLPLSNNTIEIGNVPGSYDFTLDNEEISRVTTTGTVTIGDDNSGSISVNIDPSLDLDFTKLTLISGNTINDVDATTAIAIDTLSLFGSAIGTSSNPLNTEVNKITKAESRNGSIYITNNGNLNLSEALVAGTGTEDISIVTSGDLTLGSLISPDTITLDIGGLILDGNDDSVNIDSIAFNILSATDVGESDNILDTAVDVIDVNVTGSIYLKDEDDIAIDSIYTDGNVNIYTPGAITRSGSGTVRGVKVKLNANKIGSSNAGLTITGEFEENVPPGDPEGSSDHIVSIWSNDNTITISWPAVTDPGYPSTGVYGYYYVWDTSPNTVVTPSNGIYTANTTITSHPLSDGTAHYFHVIAVDNSDNYSADQNDLGPFYLNGTVSSSQPLNYSANPARAFDNMALSLVNYRVGSFNPNPTFYFYHPIIDIDNSAFSNLIMDSDAYEFIEDSLKLKKSLPIYFGAP